MVVKEVEDPGAFLDAAVPLLLEDEARNNLILGIAGAPRDHPGVHPEYRLWISTTAVESSAPQSARPRTTPSSEGRLIEGQ